MCQMAVEIEVSWPKLLSPEKPHWLCFLIFAERRRLHARVVRPYAFIQLPRHTHPARYRRDTPNASTWQLHPRCRRRDKYTVRTTALLPKVRIRGAVSLGILYPVEHTEQQYAA